MFKSKDHINQVSTKCVSWSVVNQSVVSWSVSGQLVSDNAQSGTAIRFNLCQRLKLLIPTKNVFRYLEEENFVKMSSERQVVDINKNVFNLKM